MESIIQYFSTIDLDYEGMLKTGCILLLGTLLISVFGRFIFGKKSALNNAVSSAIGILFLYALTVVLKSAGAQFESWTAPLPFVTISGSTLHLFSFTGADYTLICAEILSMVILSFLVNLVDAWLPSGKHLLSWLFFRCLTVLIGLLFHLIVTGLFTKYLPEGIITYAPPILLAILALMLLTGALKIVVGVLLSTVNPLIAALYTFFFANIIGKQVTKAVLTTTLLAGLVCLLQYAGVFSLSVASAALIAYIPFLLILIVLWYMVNHKL
ncbi:MAG: hypothetical protein IJO04_05495 [Oscillospiraceae bacterium]|nr:hypothetical protein [Oscillospiraceae bacterium]